MPTIKQKRAFKALGVNGGNITEAMKTAGYGNTKTDKLTNSQGWQELTAKYLPDDLLLKVHLDGLKAEKWITPHDAPNFKDEDQATRAKFLDMAYKAKGNYVAEKSPTTINIEELKITIQQNLASFRTDNTRAGISPQSTEAI